MKLRDIAKYRVIEKYLPRSSNQTRQIDSSSFTTTGSKNELDYYNFDVTKPPEISDYIKNRFLPIFKQYKNNARLNTRRLRVWRVSIIVLTMFMIIFNVIVISGNNVSSNRSSSIIAIGLVSSIAAALILGFTAFLQLTKSQENWLLYSTISEKLEREYNLFKFKGGPYSFSTNKEKEEGEESDNVNRINKLFVEVVENIILAQGSDHRPMYSSSTPTNDTIVTNHRQQTSSSTSTVA